MSILKLKELLKEKGISGKDLSEKVGVTPASISNIVQGNSFPKPELLKQIAKALEVDIRELFIPTIPTNTETIYVNRNGSFVPIGEIKK
ncbi:helix-turn-helix domain-containing protein [Flavivirga jejuensis]|uniref:Helix-turn-helix transcriptional regulator n=1 Tax=Flavivirga jejuensis TaxID=870487 RepID=A0ABT8WK82_9FLAO|nr:helix-turn-helix transcriptional regulator [Flavivirga jejuensis]MDO5973523.1 helix-turn-helix transcriptional regulator [Flavivirga jejuensis]